MAQYRVTISNKGIKRQPVCQICHEVIRGKPIEVTKTTEFEDGPQTEIEFVHKSCHDWVIASLKGQTPAVPAQLRGKIDTSREDIRSNRRTSEAR